MRIRNFCLLAAGAILAGGSLVWGATAPGTQPTDNKILAGPKATRTEKAGPLLAARKEGAPGERGARLQKLRAVLQELNLTEDQLRQIKQLFQEEKAQFQQWENEHKDLVTLREELRKAKEAGDKEEKPLEIISISSGARHQWVVSTS